MDKISAERRSYNMRQIRSKSTAPELTVRRLLFQEGYRYRLHAARLPGRPDLVFAGRRKVIFVHGCFWHLHQDCIDGRTPKSNQAYWSPKLLRNRQRDVENKKSLQQLGWKSLTVWECEVNSPKTLRRIKAFLGAPRTG